MATEKEIFIKIVKGLKESKIASYADIGRRIGRGEYFVRTLINKGRGAVTQLDIDKLKEVFPELMSDEDRATQASDSEKELKVENYDLRKENEQLKKERDELLARLEELEKSKLK